MKNLVLLGFVSERIDSRGRRPKGSVVVAEWNEEYPGWSYGQDTRTFWRDYNRVYNPVLEQAGFSPAGNFEVSAGMEQGGQA